MAQPTPPLLKWIEIDDFTPGIVNNGSLALGGSAVPGRQPGAAQSAYGCIALPNGGLAPGPGFVTPSWSATQRIVPNHAIATGVGAKNMINGLFVNGPIFFPAEGILADELIIGQIQLDSSGNQRFFLDSLQIPGVSHWSSIIDTGANSQHWPFCTMTGGLTRSNPSPSLAGFPTWLLECWYTGGSANAAYLGTPYQINYPDPTTSTPNFIPHLLQTPATGYPAQAIVHQNRMILLKFFQTDYPEFGGTPTALYEANESFNYTDPPNSTVLGTQNEIFVQEDPSGYGAWGSMSASELFLVKNNGGGVVISGDINSPSVTRLPGVTPTRGLMSRAGATPIGLVYAVNQRGLWVWNGGNTSQKISNQLDDNFMINQSMPQVWRGPTVDIVPWGDWIIVTNDWLYDTNTGGWWQLSPGGQGHLFYGVSSDGNSLYSTIPVPSNTYFMDVYSRSNPASGYSWTSYPMRSPDDAKNKSLVVREVVIRAEGAGSIITTLTGTGGTTSAGRTSPSASLTFLTSTQPQMQRQAVGLNAQDVTITLTSIGLTGQPAPVIFSVAIGYEEVDALVSAT